MSRRYLLLNLKSRDFPTQMSVIIFKQCKERKVIVDAKL